MSWHRGGVIDLGRSLAEPPLLETDARRLERIRLDHVRAGLEVGGVDRFDHVGARDREIVEAAFPALPAEVVGGELARLDLGPHAAVVEQHAGLQDLEQPARRGRDGGTPSIGGARMTAAGRSDPSGYRSAVSTATGAARLTLPACHNWV